MDAIGQISCIRTKSGRNFFMFVCDMLRVVSIKRSIPMANSIATPPQTFSDLVEFLSGDQQCSTPVWISILKENGSRSFVNFWTFVESEAPGHIIRKVIESAENILNDPACDGPADYATFLAKSILLESGDHVDVALEAEEMVDVLRDGDIHLSILLGEEAISFGVLIVGKGKSSLKTRTSFSKDIRREN